MKPAKVFLAAIVLLCASAAIARGLYFQAYFIIFTGSAAMYSWRDVLDHSRKHGAFCGGPTLVATLPVTHEDLSDQLVLLDPEDMPVTSMLPKGEPAKETIYRAPVDKLEAPTMGGEKEHPVLDRTKVKNRQGNRAKLFGGIQHFRETYGASLIAQQVTNPAGIESVLADSKYKALVALKQKMELVFCSDQDIDEIGANDAGLTRGLVAWGFSGAQPNDTFKVPEAYRPLAAQCVALANVGAVTEAQVRTMLKNLRIARRAAVDVVGLCTLDYADVFDQFFFEQVPVAGSAVPTRHFNFDADDDMAYLMMVKSYATRFGKVTPVPTQYLNGVRDMAPGLTGDLTNGSPVIPGILNMPLNDKGEPALQPYSLIKGTGILAGAYIVSVDSATQITISANATATSGDVALTLGRQTHCAYIDPKYFSVKTNLVPSHKPMPEDGGGEDAYVEAIASLFCTYPALIGTHYSA